MTQRIIKYRAWDGEQMLYPEDGDIIIHIDDGGLAVYQLIENDPDDVEAISDYSTKQINAEVMQFTGLLDKHGKEIYEGDVLSFDYDPEMAICGENHDRKPIESDYDRAVYVVQYEDGYRLCGKGIHQKLYLHAFRFQYTKRLGDIYTTPELVDPKMIER